MEMYPHMSYHRNEQEESAVVTKALESTNHLTPFHIPPSPFISPERYEELKEAFQLCKPAMKGGQRLARCDVVYPESHRKYEPPYRFGHENHYNSNAQDTLPRLPDLPENSVQYTNDEKYQSSGSGLVENRYRPFHPYIHCNTDMKGHPHRNEGAGEPCNIARNTIGWQEQHDSSDFAEENDEFYDPRDSRTQAPKPAVKPPELDISYRAANLLESVKKALWMSTYKRDYTGTGSMNPLMLEDYDAKIIGRATGELGKYVDLRESFPSATSQVRPLEGRIARALQGKQSHISNSQQNDSSDVHRPSLQYADDSPRYLEETWNNSRTSPGASQQDPNVAKTLKLIEYLLQPPIQPPREYPRENGQIRKFPQNKYQKITDTWKTDKLYQRQIDIPPEPESTQKPEEPIYYEDLPPSRLSRYIIWHHPVSLSKPGTKNQFVGKQTNKPTPGHVPDLRDIQPSPSFPKWIPNCGVARPQTKLLDIQNSFSKGGAIKILKDLTQGGVRDLRDHDKEGRRHKFQGIHASFLH
ncbi:sperm-associated microtubule inner protein 4 isoform X2 [Anolis carolinensis]|uniref:sperm-associated microtubule inner protein 4 isoform X2 n=1 Tax=Anolis carolinensis TaxID=28377 RepID=UPI002F2B4B69